VIDHSGLGVQDVHNKCLRMIGDPVKRLEKDPIILLCAIKYITLGYRPLRDLEKALLNLSSSNNEKTHVYAVMMKYLKNLPPTQLDEYFKHLSKLGLLQQLFKIPNNTTPREAEELLKQRKKEGKDLLIIHFLLFPRLKSSKRVKAIY
jgi:tRNA nucleotidyltransferase/poly(A) polymerase